MSIESEITGKPPLDIIFRSVGQPRDESEFQRALDRIAEKLWGSNENPFGGKRLWLEWGGTAYRYFFKYKVPKYRRIHYEEQVAWGFAGNPFAKLKHERKYFFTEELNPENWPKRWHSYKVPEPIYATVAWGYANWFVCLWMSPAKACIDWNSFMYGSPEPRHGYYYPILPIAGEPTPTNPFGTRHPDSVDLQFVEKIVYEMMNEHIHMGKHIDEPWGDSEINNFNRWISKALQHEKQEQREKDREERMALIYDVLMTTQKTSFTSNRDSSIINPHGGKSTRDVTLYMSDGKPSRDTNNTSLVDLWRNE